jgi:hypothetical protein
LMKKSWRFGLPSSHRNSTIFGAVIRQSSATAPRLA